MFSSGDWQAPKIFGKHRGKVLENVDPLMLGRIMVDVPALPGIHLNWAMPCVPYAGPEVGFYAIPPVGADVWVEFEGGNPNAPIWSGCFWSEGQVPLGGPLPETKIFKTESVTLILNDVPGAGGLTIEVAPPAVEVPLTMTFNVEGVQILVGETTTISMTVEDTIVLTTPPAEVTISAEAISLAIPASTMTLAEEAIEIATPDMNVTGNVSVEGAVEVEGDIEITGAIEIQGNVELTGAIEVLEGEVAIVAPSIEIVSESIIEIAAPLLNITAPTLVVPDLLIDGQQPIVI
jgi:type VI secretion system (T6SS) baseplate-like injector VgrG